MTKKRKGFTMIDDVVIDNGFLLGASAQMVFIKLSKHMDNDTGECHPSIELIASSTGLNRTTVIRGIKKLESLGLITVRRGKKVGAKTTVNYYMVNWNWRPERSQYATTTKDSAVASCDLGSRNMQPAVGAPCDTNYTQELNPRTRTASDSQIDTSKNGQDVPTSETNAAEMQRPKPIDNPDFAELWHRYPSRHGEKRGKAQAAAAFARIPSEDVPGLMRALTAFCDSPTTKDGYGIKDAHRWLAEPDDGGEAPWREWLNVEPQPGQSPKGDDGKPLAFGSPEYMAWCKENYRP